MDRTSWRKDRRARHLIVHMTGDDRRGSGEMLGASKCPMSIVDDSFNPFVEPYVSDPWPTVAKAREERPVFYSPEIDFFVVTRFEDIYAILGDTETFSNDIIVRRTMTPIYESSLAELAQHGRALEYLQGPTMLDEDDPGHKIHRKRVTHLFLNAHISKFEPRIRKLANDYIDQFVKVGRADLVDEL